MSPIPIAMCGKFPAHAANFSKMMLPEYEVVHHFSTTPECIQNLPSLLAGHATPSASGVGTNHTSPGSSPKIPKAMFVGGGFSEDELQQMLKVEDGKTIPWIAADPEEKRKVESVGLEAAMRGIVERAKGKFGEIGVREGGGEVKGGLWRY